MFREVLTDAGTRAGSLLTLAYKTGEELLQARQFLDSDRRGDLYRKGMRQLLPIFHLSNRNADEIRKEFLFKLMFAEEVGFSYATHPGIYLAAVLLPVETRISFGYITELSNSSPLGPQIARINSTTQLHCATPDNKSLYPSEGFQTSEGILLSPQKRAPEDQIQHGGYFVDNNTGQLEVWDYEHLRSARRRTLSAGQFLIEANWYMNSRSQQQVVNRDNMQTTRPYNGLGILGNANGERRYYVITTHESCYRGITLKVCGTSNAKWANPTLKQVAALSNILAEKHGFKKWSLGGLEYCGGGVVVTDKTSNYDSLTGGYRFIAHKG